MTESWDPASPGVLRLPSGRLVRGRGLRRPKRPAGDRHATSGPDPEFGFYLLGHRPPAMEWTSTWVHWPDFRLPVDRAAAAEAIREAWTLAGQGRRVEVACGGGRGRTGTMLACMAVLDGVPGAEAVGYVRERYDAHAVETPWQRRFVARFGSEPPARRPR